ncbi:MAG: hypothetical protein ACTS9Y_00395 [Methylophilus sp.]|uniref:hypothetical protein n=1 Tax=Methylophilus sp. TaxID=29541 RepID=UPI003F9FF157
MTILGVELKYPGFNAITRAFLISVIGWAILMQLVGADYTKSSAFVMLSSFLTGALLNEFGVRITQGARHLAVFTLFAVISMILTSVVAEFLLQ